MESDTIILALSVTCAVLALALFRSVAANGRLRRLIVPFDRDHDGRPGG
jgi:hypothetical protein